MAYRADIEIAVKGAQELKRLQDRIRDVSTTVDNFNSKIEGIGGGYIVRNINNLTSLLGKAAAAFNEVSLANGDALAAARVYSQATDQLNAGLAERVALLKQVKEEERQLRLSEAGRRFGGPAIRETRGTVELGPGPASPVALRSELRGRTQQILDERKGRLQLNVVLEDQFEIERKLQNNKLDEKAARVQAKLDKQAVAAAESATQISKLNDRQAEFITRTDAAAQAAARQTAAFYKQARVAKEVAKINAAAPAAQLLLAPAAPGAPAMGGGARRRVTGAIERLGGARTTDEAATTLRFAQGLKEQVRPLSQVQALYAGIAGEALKLQSIKALPDTQMLNAAARGLQTIEAIEGRRLQTAQRRGQKLQQIQDYYGDVGMGNAGTGFQGPVMPPGGVQRRTRAGTRANAGFGRAAAGALSNAAVGGAFPLLFGQSGAAATGGALGGALGSIIPGVGGFGGSLIGTIIGEKVGQGSQIKELAADIGFSAAQTKLLSTAFQQAGREFDKFSASVQNIRGLSLAVDDQAKAIQLVSALTQNYGGQIDKVTNAFTSALESGKVSQATLNQLTSQGIPIQQALANKYKVSRSALLQMAKDGKISTQDLIDTLVNLGNKGPVEITKNKTALDLLKTSVENLGSAFFTLGSNIVTALTPILDWLGKRIADIVNIASTAINEVARLIERVSTAPQAAARAALTRGELPFGVQGVGEIIGQQRLTKITRQASTGPLGTINQKQLIKLLLDQPEFAAAKKPEPPKLTTFNPPSQAPPSGGGAGSNKAANEAKRLAEQTKKQLDDAFKLNELASARLETQVSLTGEESLEAEFNRIALERRIKFVDLQKQAKSQKERELLVSAQLSTILADNNQYEKDKQKLFAQQTAELYTQIGLSEVLGKKFQGTLAGGFMGTSGTGTFRTDLNLMPGLTGGKLGEEFATIEQQLKNLLDPATQVITAAEGISNAFGTAFKGLIDGTMTAQEALAGFFQSVASNFADMAAQMIAKYIQMQIIGLAQKFLPISGGIFGAGGATDYSGVFGGGGGLVSNQFGTGGEYIFGGFRAGGGPVSAGTPYIVGEKGPELFMPGRSGTVIPNDALGGGSTSVVVNVDASGNSNVQGDQAQAKQLGVVVSAAVQAELVKQQRPGGLLAGTRR